MDFEWSEPKAQLNFQKHGISFEQAKDIWDSVHLEVESLAYSEEGEKRSATMGRIENKIYVAIWTKRKNKIRLISVRRARENEEKIFYKKIQNSD